jgi:hypothetical protein
VKADAVIITSAIANLKMATAQSPEAPDLSQLKRARRGRTRRMADGFDYGEMRVVRLLDEFLANETEAQTEGVRFSIIGPEAFAVAVEILHEHERLDVGEAEAERD